MLHTLHLDEEQANGLATKSQGSGLINGALLVLSSDNFATVRCGVLACISPIYPLYLPYISPIGALRRAGEARRLAQVSK